MLALGNTPSSFPPVSPRHVAAPILARVTRRLDIDHVLIAVPDLSAAAPSFTARYGLASTEGGHHPAWGTANRIVPLGTSYLELVAVVDEAKAQASPFGRWVAGAAAEDFRLLGWAVRTDALDADARRLDLQVTSGSRLAPDGELLRWRSAGIEVAAADPILPFFIERDPGSKFPGQLTGADPEQSAKIAKLVVDGDVRRLADWLGENNLPIVVRPGSPRVAAVVLSRGAKELVVSERPAGVGPGGSLTSGVPLG